MNRQQIKEYTRSIVKKVMSSEAAIVITINDRKLEAFEESREKTLRVLSSFFLERPDIKMEIDKMLKDANNKTSK